MGRYRQGKTNWLASGANRLLGLYGALEGLFAGVFIAWLLIFGRTNGEIRIVYSTIQGYPRAYFYITMGAAGALGLGLVLYFILGIGSALLALKKRSGAALCRAMLKIAAVYGGLLAILAQAGGLILLPRLKATGALLSSDVQNFLILLESAVIILLISSVVKFILSGVLKGKTTAALTVLSVVSALLISAMALWVCFTCCQNGHLFSYAFRAILPFKLSGEAFGFICDVLCVISLKYVLIALFSACARGKSNENYNFSACLGCALFMAWAFMCLKEYMEIMSLYRLSAGYFSLFSLIKLPLVALGLVIVGAALCSKRRDAVLLIGALLMLGTVTYQLILKHNFVFVSLDSAFDTALPLLYALWWCALMIFALISSTSGRPLPKVARICLLVIALLPLCADVAYVAKNLKYMAQRESAALITERIIISYILPACACVAAAWNVGRRTGAGVK